MNVALLTKKKLLRVFIERLTYKYEKKNHKNKQNDFKGIILFGKKTGARYVRTLRVSFFTF